MSPSEDSTEGERERLISESNSKSRSHSGEDAGIGSEQGEHRLFVGDWPLKNELQLIFMEAISSSSPQSEIDWDQPRSQNVV